MATQLSGSKEELAFSGDTPAVGTTIFEAVYAANLTAWVIIPTGVTACTVKIRAAFKSTDPTAQNWPVIMTIDHADDAQAAPKELTQFAPGRWKHVVVELSAYTGGGNDVEVYLMT